MPFPCVPIFLKGPYPVRLRTAFVAVGTLVLTTLPVTANANVVHPQGTCGYNTSILEDDSTAISVAFVPQCSGEAAASPSIWEYVPISKGDQSILYTVTPVVNNIVVLTYDCPGTAPDTYQVIYNYSGMISIQNISDDCGTFTEP